MTTKNIIRTPWPVISTFQRWPFGSPSISMYWTPGCISSRRMYMVKLTETRPRKAAVTR